MQPYQKPNAFTVKPDVTKFAQATRRAYASAQAARKTASRIVINQSTSLTPLDLPQRLGKPQ